MGALLDGGNIIFSDTCRYNETTMPHARSMRPRFPYDALCYHKRCVRTRLCGRHWRIMTPRYSDGACDVRGGGVDQSERLAAAVASVRRGGMSVRRAAHLHGVAKSTLHRYTRRVMKAPRKCGIDFLIHHEETPV